MTAVYLLAEVIICSHDSPETLNLLLCIRVTVGQGHRGWWNGGLAESKTQRLFVEAGPWGKVEYLGICPGSRSSAGLNLFIQLSVTLNRT